MGVLADLVPQSQPAMFGAGVTASGTFAATWLWVFTDVTDASGDPVDLSGVTGTCELVNLGDDTVAATLDFDGDVAGGFTVGLDEADTEITPGRYRWRLSLSDGTDVVQVWGGSASKFNVEEA